MIDTAIVWLRQDLRLSDQPALAAAAARHQRIVPLYIWAPDEEGEWAPGAASRWWLHDSLESLNQALKSSGSGLVLRCGASLQELSAVIQATGARAVYWNARYEPAAAKRDESIRKVLAKTGVAVHIYNGSLLSEPASILNKSGHPYLVYGAYWRSLCTTPIEGPSGSLRTLPPLPPKLGSVPLDSLSLKPKIPWDSGFKKLWQAGEDRAQKILNTFCRSTIVSYADTRDIPGCSGTSRLAPHLHFGEISPRQVWAAAAEGLGVGPTTFRKQIAWREFSYYLMHHHPYLATKPLRPEFKYFPWKENSALLKAWQQGLTGYPIVDAGMRELWQTGWMHNRVRMIVASFLVKDLCIHWLKGAQWFWDTLVDADLANNTQGWQWTSGSGADASPFFRVFNPTLQGKKFDPKGVYVRHWVPELKKLRDSQIHAPWESEQRLDYPAPIVDHNLARLAALEAYAMIKKKKPMVL